MGFNPSSTSKLCPGCRNMRSIRQFEGKRLCATCRGVRVKPTPPPDKLPVTSK